MQSFENQKVVLLGEGCVGKTSIVTRFLFDDFNERHQNTLQAAFFEKKVNVEGKRIKLVIWDTAGQERFHALGPIYYRDSNGAILVYDITDRDSFERVKKWVRELRRMLGNSVLLFIVGNKIDLEKERKVSEEEASTYAESVNGKHMQTSARNNRGVHELFLELSKSLINLIETEKKRVIPQGYKTGANDAITIIADPAKNRSGSSGCCS